VQIPIFGKEQLMKDTHIYKRINECLIKTDVYHENKNTATLIYFHGGALISGTRTMIPEEQIHFYTHSGFNVVSVDYRLAPETKLQSIVEDIRDAINWVRTTGAGIYGFDPGKIAIVGGSAGGYLSLLAGTGICGYRPRAIVAFYGYGDILGEWYTRPSEFYCQKPLINSNSAYGSVGHNEISEGTRERSNFYLYCRQNGIWVNEVTGYDPIKEKSQLLKYNPVNNVTINYPPTLLLHGTMDTDVPYEQSVMMNERLERAGVPCELLTMDGVGHDFDKNFNNKDVSHAFERVVQFLKTYI
jgi:acetyl esterase/lipase